MHPIPVAFHIWFLEVHTYGIGLALTFWFGLRYTERRMRNAGYPWHWVTGMFVWVLVSAIIGARALHVLSNLSLYTAHPAQVISIWQGGLSSFGGILFAVPVAIVTSRRRCPSLPSLRFADLMAPVLMACWGIGRLLGPQLMFAGGGHPTHQWFGMYYAGQVGPRLPVPIFQAMEDLSIFAILLLVERWLRTTGPAPGAGADTVVASAGATAPVEAPTPAAFAVPAGAGAAVIDATIESEVAVDGTDRPADAPADAPAVRPGGEEEPTEGPDPRFLPPAGIVIGVGMVLWGIERFLDEHLWLGEDGHLGSLLVQLAGIALAVAGIALLVSRIRPLREWRTGGGRDATDLPHEPGGGADETVDAGRDLDGAAPSDSPAADRSEQDDKVTVSSPAHGAAGGGTG